MNKGYKHHKNIAKVRWLLLEKMSCHIDLKYNKLMRWPQKFYKLQAVLIIGPFVNGAVE